MIELTRCIGYVAKMNFSNLIHKLLSIVLKFIHVFIITGSSVAMFQ